VFNTFQEEVRSLFASRRTILSMVRSSGTERHHAAFCRLFSDAPWSIDRVGLAVRRLREPPRRGSENPRSIEDPHGSRSLKLRKSS
jgi:hypothetical protein